MAILPEKVFKIRCKMMPISQLPKDTRPQLTLGIPGTEDKFWCLPDRVSEKLDVTAYVICRYVATKYDD